MNDLSILTIVVITAFIHASFQLSISVQTLVSGHAIGARRSQSTVLGLLSGFTSGAVVMTALCLSFAAYIVDSVLRLNTQTPLVWSIACGLLIALAVFVGGFYYRRGSGTALWLPRQTAHSLAWRTKHAKTSVETFNLGLSSVLAELLFLFIPFVVGALALHELSASWQLIAFASYVIIATAPLLIVTVMISSGHKLSTVQKWREANKRFLQFAASGGLVVLGFYIYTEQVLTATTYATGGF